MADVHAQARRGLLLTAAFVAAAVVAGVSGIGAGWWLPLHLFVVGGLLSAISAVTPMLAVTWSSAPAPRPRLAAAQRWVLAAGTIALVVGREVDQPQLFAAGAAAVVAAMVALAGMLTGIRRRSATARFAPAIEAYVAAVAAGAVGMTIGLLLGTGRGAADAVVLREAHLTLNLLGLIGLVIAGTVPFFAATQLRARMSPRATATAMRTTIAVLAVATAVTAAAHLTARPGVAAAGLIAYAAGLLGIGALSPTPTPRRLRWAGPRVLQLAAGLVWWALMTVVLAVNTIRDTGDRAILQALVIGGFAQILVASLAYLGPVLRGGGHRQLTAGFAITRSWVSLAAGNAAGLAALAGHGPSLAAALGIWLTDVLLRAARLLATMEPREKT